MWHTFYFFLPYEKRGNTVKMFTSIPEDKILENKIRNVKINNPVLFNIY